jgi:tRNA G10  N-methylase Trm11
LDAIDKLLPKAGPQTPGEEIMVLDPFVGTGKIYQLENAARIITGVEIEPPLAALHGHTVLASALELPWPNDSFDAIATSPCYGNRMSDHHDAKDGSTRRSYTHDMRRWLNDPNYELDPDNSGKLHWGALYRNFHRRAWREAIRVLKPDGVFVLNVKDFYKAGERQHITDWHIDTLVELGLQVDGGILVPVAGMGYGANRGARVQFETVVRMVKR